MDAPDKPHVRVYHGDIYIERAPSAWVMVVSAADWNTLNDPERNYMISKALKMGLDCLLPNPRPSEIPPIE